MATKQFTRNDYLDKKCTHREYYAQFVTQWQRNQVSRYIGLDRLASSDDEYFNDIPLDDWDRIGVAGESVKKMKSLGDGYSLAGAVCINKEAARQLVEAA